MTGCPSGVPAFPAPARLRGDDLPALGGMLVLYCGRAGVQLAPMSVAQPTRLVSPKRTCGQHGLMADMGGFATVPFRAASAANGHPPLGAFWPGADGLVSIRLRDGAGYGLGNYIDGFRHLAGKADCRQPTPSAFDRAGGPFSLA